jgi:DNA-binding NtrC family response regulator
MKAYVLFVDDEASLLRGLKRALHCQAAEWNMTFVQSAPEALALMESTPFHVVVSDFRMPQMNGLEFLKEVMTRHPHTVRLVLSGEVNHLSTSALREVAHHIFLKPFDVGHLISAISTELCAKPPHQPAQQTQAE